MFKKFQLVARNSRHALATGSLLMCELKIGFCRGCGGKWLAQSIGVMFTGEIK